MKKKLRKLKIRTRSGEIKTPFFMPDATRGFVKFLPNESLKEAGVQALVVNTYHLYLQPGTSTIKKAGGIHKFMNWDGILLSDSGGYQVFSLIHKNPKMGKITDNEVIFRSPLNGTMHRITPEKSIKIQFDLGVDAMVCLDDPAPNGYSRAKIADATERTIVWAKRCKAEYEKQIKKRKISADLRPLIFGVIQGGEHLDLRQHCARELAWIGFDGYGFGARHVDEEGNFLEDVLKKTAELIPKKSLRFALGIGTPEDILRCHQFGWDMFDCVIPTREGRHGRLFLRKKNFQFSISNFQKNSKNKKLKTKTRHSDKSFYETININNKKFRNSFLPVDPACSCRLCRKHTRAYLHHLFSSKDPLGSLLAAEHNLKFYSDLMEIIGKSE